MINKPNDKLFNDIAKYYDTYRPGLPINIITYLNRRFALSDKSTVLDLGCGTGQVAKSICNHILEIICVDPDKEMISAAKKSLNATTGCNKKTRFICSTAEEFLAPVNSINLVTICRAFHWMNQDAVLANCKAALKTGGGIALLGDSSLWNGNEPWQNETKEVVQQFLGQKRRAGDGYFNPKIEPYNLVLKRNGYTDICTKEFEVTRNWNINSILGYLYSTSFASRKMFGSRLKDFEKTLLDKLGNPSQNEIFTEKTTFMINSGKKE